MCIRDRARAGLLTFVPRTWPDENVDEMVVAPVNQGRYRPARNVVEATADEDESLFCQILHCGGEVQLALEPWLDSMPLRRRDISQVGNHQGADVAIHQPVSYTHLDVYKRQRLRRQMATGSLRL